MIGLFNHISLAREEQPLTAWAALSRFLSRTRTVELDSFALTSRCSRLKLDLSGGLQAVSELQSSVCRAHSLWRETGIHNEMPLIHKCNVGF